MPSPGVLAIQGSVSPHLEVFSRLGASAFQVRSSKDLEKADRLVIPGGESSTMIKLIKNTQLWNELLQFGKSNPIWGVCAGAILLAKEIENPHQSSLSLMNIKAVRNYYGSQRESFSSEIYIESLSIQATVDFIRAPKLSPLSSSVEVLSELNGDAIFLREGKHIATSFHSELGGTDKIHEFFLSV